MRDKRTPKDVCGEARDTRETRVSLARAPFFPAPITSWPVNRRCFIFLFVIFKNIGELARESKIKNVYFLLPPELPPCAGGQ